jgi:hypothetical protein
MFLDTIRGMNIMSSTETNKYEERRAFPSPSMYSERWRPSWWTRRALLGTAAGAALGTYGLSLGLTAVVRFDTFWLGK